MEEFFIVGAGPAGLSCALFLQKNGQKPRIIDTALQSTHLTKALLVNQKTLEIMGEFGLADELKSIGFKIDGMRMLLLDKEIELSCEALDIITIPQTKTEAFLERKLKEAGITVERGVEFITYEEKNGSYELTLKSEKGDEKVNTKYLIGADGMHSSVRQAAQIPFYGKDYGLVIYGIDCLLDKGDLPPKKPCMKITEKGEMIGVIPIENELYRVITNQLGLENHLPLHAKIREKVWEAKFHIHCKHAEYFSKGNLYLMGDSAHVHSPLGGRGLNLAIEDTHAFVTLWKANKLSEYSKARKARAQQVLKETDMATRLLMSHSPFANFCKRYILPQVLKIKKIREFIVKRNMGVG